MCSCHGLLYAGQRLTAHHDFRPIGAPSQKLPLGRRRSGALSASENLDVSGCPTLSEEKSMATRTESLWRTTHTLGGFAPLGGDIEADVAIVGGGISGLTA